MMDAAETTEDLLQRCLRYVTCDAPHCQQRNPQHFCVRCNLVHYCSMDCKKRHAKEHEPDCFALEEMRGRMVHAENGGDNADVEILLEAETAEDDSSNKDQPKNANASCGICLGDLTNPVILKRCQHAFCFKCLKQWNDYQSTSSSVVVTNNENSSNEDESSQPQQPKTTCPLCRQEIPQITASLLDSAMCRMAAAQKSGISAEERKRCCELAKKDVETVQSASSAASINNNDNNKNHPDQQHHHQQEPYRAQIALLLAEIAILEEEYFRALQILQATSDWMQEAVFRGRKLAHLQERGNTLLQKLGDDDNNVQNSHYAAELEDIIVQIKALSAEGMATDATSHAKICLKIGQVQRLQKDYEAAKSTYQSLTQQYPDVSDLTAPQQRELFMAMSETAYHLKGYDVAIGLGEAALLMNRYFPWSHKYVAMAYREQGNLVKAIQLAAEAVVYESPWDYQHLEQVEEWYQDEFGGLDEKEIMSLERRKRRSNMLRWLSFVLALIAILAAHIMWSNNSKNGNAVTNITPPGNNESGQESQVMKQRKIETGEL